MVDQIDYRKLNEKVEKELRKSKTYTRYLFLTMGAVFVVVTITNSYQGLNALVMWGMALMFFVFSLSANFSIFDNSAREQIMARELSKEMLKRAQAEMLQAYEKPKRDELTEESLYDEVLELGDDGELVPVRRKKKS